MADGSEFAWFGLTSRQRSIWLDLQATGNLTNFQIGLYFTTKQKFDLDALRAALADVAQRHDALRLKIDPDRPRQQLLGAVEIPIEVVDLSGDASAVGTFERLVEQRFLEPLPLEQRPLFEFMVALADGGDGFMMKFHHIVMDGISLGLVLADIAARYNARTGRPTDDADGTSYLQFHAEDVRYCGSTRLKRDLEHWEQRLSNLPRGIFEDKFHRVKADDTLSIERSQIEEARYQNFLATCEREGLRAGNVILAITSMLLSRSSGSRDLVLGVTFPGRSKENRQTVGLFNGVLPVRVRVPGEASLSDLTLDITQHLNRDYLHYRSPLEDIWKTVSFSEKRRRRYACDVLVSYIPLEVVDFGVDFGGEQLAIASMRGPEASPLAIYVSELSANRPVTVEFAFNRAFLTREDARALSEGFHELVDRFIADPASVRAAAGGDEPAVADAGGAAERAAASARDPAFQIRVLAGFTADPIAAPLQLWANKLGLDVKVSIAPYNQVFQELLDPRSPARRNRTGANLVLIRLEDWVRDRPVTDEQAFLEAVAGDLLAALTQAATASGVPYIVMVCAPSARWDVGGPMAGLQERLLNILRDGLTGAAGLSLLTYAECRALYPVENELDLAGDQLGHLPYTSASFAAMASLLARRLHLVSRQPIKVVVVDCDNTLWGGVVGEDGVDGLRLDPGHIELQTRLVELSGHGVLVCLCSKNVEADVLAVFERRSDMVLKLEHVIAHRVNWDAKSENIRSLALELNLGLDSFVFLDDNPIEISEVESALPQVVAVQSESNHALAEARYRHLWLLDSLPSTGEDKQRLERYRQNALRSEALQSAPSYANFIDGLDLRVRIEPPQEADLPRLAQLTARTNQFNLNGVRRSIEDVRRWTAAPDSIVCSVSVTDRFGDYGLVGMLAAHIDQSDVVIDTLLLSCRVLGRGVEHRMIAELGRLAGLSSVSQVVIPLRVTDRNQPIRRFLDSLSAAQQTSGANEWLHRISVAEAAACAFQPAEAEATTQGDDPEPAVASAPATGRLAGRSWLDIATTLNTAVAVAAAVRAATIQQRSAASAFRAPRSDTERALADIFCEMMSLDRISIDDDFFDLGMHSLMAVQIVSRIREHFAIRLAVSTIFDSPTLAKLSEAMASEAGRSGYQPIVPLQIGDDAPPLFCCHPANGDAVCYMRLVKAFGPDQTIYGFEASGLAEGEPLPESLEQMAADYIKAMIEAYPSGPYYLLGWSFGGVLAFEMAYQLDQAGRDVALVAFMDAAVPDGEYADYAYPELTDEELDNQILEGIAPHLDEMRQHFDLPPREGVSETFTWYDVIENFQDLGLVPEGYTVPEMRRKTIVFGHCGLLYLMYQPKQISAPIMHFLAEDADTMTDFDWTPLATQPVEVAPIPCNHFRMGFEPNVNMIARHLREVMRGETDAV